MLSCNEDNTCCKMPFGWQVDSSKDAAFRVVSFLVIQRRAESSSQLEPRRPLPPVVHAAAGGKFVALPCLQLEPFGPLPPVDSSTSSRPQVPRLKQLEYLDFVLA